MISSMYFGTYNRSTQIRGPEPVADDSPPYGTVPFCVDLKGKTIPPGFHFVPGPDQCFVCICDRGSPKWCQAVLCAPPQDCKSFRVVGSSCCDFECLDKTLREGGSIHNGQGSAAELGSRLVAWTVSIVLSVSLIYFLFRRLRKKRHLSVLRRVFLNQDGSSEANAAFSTPPPPFPYVEAFGNGVDGQTFACLAPPGGVVTITTMMDEARMASGSSGLRPVCGVVWKPDDLPPPYSEVVGAEEETVNVGCDTRGAAAFREAPHSGPPVMSPPSMAIDAEDDEPDAEDSRNDEEPGTSTRESEIGDGRGASSVSSVVEARNDSMLLVERGGQHLRGGSRGDYVDTTSLSSCASLPSSSLSEDVVMRTHV